MSMRKRNVVWHVCAPLVALLLIGCGTSTSTAETWTPDVAGQDADVHLDDAGDVGAEMDVALGDAGGDVDLPELAFCNQAPLPEFGETVDWESFGSGAITALDEWHSAQDVITHPEREALITGKFTYGPTSKDLQGERIEVWMDDCSGSYVRLGEALTDSDGRSVLTLAPDALPPVGTYALVQRVMGDNTAARSYLRVFPQETRFIVFDIDATLTTSDSELFQDIFNDLFEPLLDGDFVPEARVGAVDITKVRNELHGYQLVYITGRPYWLTEQSRGWLDDQGVAHGHLRLTGSNAESLPNNTGVGAYKAAYLAFLQDLGFEIVMAYGNATTDIFAYAEAGIAPERTFILGQHGGEEGTVALGEDYVEHLEAVRGEAPTDQPFVWTP
ncbi:hypothetical protein FRC98_08630 [Lujinxingia vulgaris]|uniref:LNS2/PITP domain-containing protein n=2 Tax=Lujinxingia vulgaris TaxID=2600176 RepID=A0A5C6XHZ2_9DELT|nr:hypothetical protein FRC98_08630 [Lujinxingia vulgaris]